MEPSLLAILVFCLCCAAGLYYLIFIKKDVLPDGRAESAVVTLLFLITPVLVIVLWFQSGSESRLQRLGFNPYPGFVSSNGIATGVGEAPIWIFSITDDAGSVLQFYKSSENHAGWSLVSESGMGLVFERGSEQLSLSVAPGNVVFALKPGE